MFGFGNGDFFLFLGLLVFCKICFFFERGEFVLFGEVELGDFLNILYLVGLWCEKIELDDDNDNDVGVFGIEMVGMVVFVELGIDVNLFVECWFVDIMLLILNGLYGFDDWFLFLFVFFVGVIGVFFEWFGFEMEVEFVFFLICDFGDILVFGLFIVGFFLFLLVLEVFVFFLNIFRYFCLVFFFM